MDNPDRYRGIVRRLIEDHARLTPADDAIESEVVIDDPRGHYELLNLGWDGIRRVHGSYIHIDVRDGKVWVQRDGTHDGVADELVEAGIPREHIVLGFKHPEIRPHTGFAVG